MALQMHKKKNKNRSINRFQYAWENIFNVIDQTENSLRRSIWKSFSQDYHLRFLAFGCHANKAYLVEKSKVIVVFYSNSIMICEFFKFWNRNWTENWAKYKKWFVLVTGQKIEKQTRSMIIHVCIVYIWIYLFNVCFVFVFFLLYFKRNEVKTHKLVSLVVVLCLHCKLESLRLTYCISFFFCENNVRFILTVPCCCWL